MAEVTVNLTGIVDSLGRIRWNDDVSLGTAFDPLGEEQTLSQVALSYSGVPLGGIDISLVGTNDRFTTAFEATGRIIFTASDGETLEVTIDNADMTESYNWTPSNSAEVVAFANHVRGLTDQSATMTLSDGLPIGSVTVNLTGVTTTGTSVRWDNDVSLGSAFSFDGSVQTLSQVVIQTINLLVNIDIDPSIDFSSSFESTGRIIFTASDGETLEVMIANADMIEAYNWTPSNSAEVITFVNHVRGLTDKTATMTLTDDLLTAPSFTDNTGDAQSWTQNTPIANITVPAASGSPTPMYVVAGSLPSGINFDAGTRVLSGTPTGSGSGTIIIRATNSEGFADWSVAYSIAVTSVAPSFIDNTGNAQNWTVGTAISPITVPTANGEPAPSYAAVGSLPAGINFDTGTRVIDGNPSAIGFGTIRVRATNSEGFADWTVAYNVAVSGPSAPDVPAEPTTSAIQQTQATINWVEPDDNGATIDHYDLQWREGTTSSWTTIGNIGGLSRTLTGLDIGTEYQARVQANNSEGDSGYSNPVTFTTVTSTPNVPATPTTSGLGQAQGTINWVEPDDNGATIDHYDLQWRQGITGAWTTIADISGLSQTLIGLTFDTQYQAQVQASNSEGDSGYSNPITFTTLSDTLLMPRDEDAIRTTKWADTGDRATPESLNVNREEGFDETFSQVGGSRISREMVNQLFAEWSAQLSELNQHGLLPWDIRVDYVHAAWVVGYDTNLYKSAQSSGPATSNATNPVTDAANTYWTRFP